MPLFIPVVLEVEFSQEVLVSLELPPSPASFPPTLLPATLQESVRGLPQPALPGSFLALCSHSLPISPLDWKLLWGKDETLALTCTPDRVSCITDAQYVQDQETKRICLYTMRHLKSQDHKDC